MTAHRYRFYVLQTLDRRYVSTPSPTSLALTDNFEMASTWDSFAAANFQRERYEHYLTVKTGESISLAVREINRVLPGG